MTFSEALELVQQGEAMLRTGWNGKDMYVSRYEPDNDETMTSSYLFIKTATGEFVPWVPSQTDMLAADWEKLITEEPIPEADVTAQNPTLPYTQLRLETNSTLGTVNDGYVVDLAGGTFWQSTSMQRVKAPHERQDVPQTCSFSGGKVKCPDHGWQPGDPICFITTGALPSPVKFRSKTNPDWPLYYVLADGLTDDDFNISDQPGTDGPAIKISGSGTGTHSVHDVRNAYPIRMAKPDLTVQNAIVECSNSALMHGDIFNIQNGGYYNSATVMGTDSKHCSYRYLRVGGIGGVGGPFAVWDPIRTGGLNDGNQVPGEYDHTVEKVWLSDIRDDGIENDKYSKVRVKDSLIENAYYAFSARGSMVHPRLEDRWEIDDCLISFRGYPNAREVDGPCTFDITGSVLVKRTKHLIKIGEQVKFGIRTEGGALPGGMGSFPYSMYHVIEDSYTPDQFRISNTANGPPLVATSPGSGQFDVRVFANSFGGLYKYYKGYSPKMNIRNSLIMFPYWDNRWDARFQMEGFWVDMAGEISDTFFLYFGTDDANFGVLPTGVTLIKGDEAKETWTEARADWIASHKVIPRLLSDTE